MPLVIFPKDNKVPPSFAELQFKKWYPSAPLLNLDSKGLIPVLLVQPCGFTVPVHRNGNTFSTKSKDWFLEGTVWYRAGELTGGKWDQRGWLWPAGKCQDLTGNQSSTCCWKHIWALCVISACVIIYMLVPSPSTSRFVTFIELSGS